MACHVPYGSQFCVAFLKFNFELDGRLRQLDCGRGIDSPDLQSAFVAPIASSHGRG